MSWTKEQQYAIETKDKSLLVSAAAGSGKTAVLVERIVKLIIEDKVDVDRFLVVTFTKAAAEEMKGRIHSALIKQLGRKGSDRKFINRQIACLASASISTLHAFCLDIAMKYFQVVNLDPGLKIGEQTQMSLLKDRALDKLMEEEYEKQDPLFESILEMYNNYRDESPIKDIIKRFHEFLVNRPYPRQWAKKALDHFTMSEERFSKTDFYDEFKYLTEGKINSAIEHMDISVGLAEMAGDKKATALLQEEKGQLENLKINLRRGYSEFYSALNEMSFRTLRLKVDDLNAKDEIKLNRDIAKKIWKKIKSSLETNDPEYAFQDIKEILPEINYLTEMVFRFDELFKKMKLEKKVMDFNDIEHLTLDILQHREVAQELRDQYEYIFVDEYQDSNEIQDTIISKIMRDDNVFFVGDVKQSIYRFRMADPTLFMKKYDDFFSSDSGKKQVINLNKNFRSHSKIVDFINAVFEKIMSKYAGEVEYDSNSRLYVGRDSQSYGHVCLTVIENDKKGVCGEEITKIDSVETEAHYIARKIRELVDKGVYDSETGERISISYRDIAILLRSTKNWAETYYEVLNSYDIPVYAESHTGYFDTLEIRLIVQLLKVIDNIYQDIPLISVMRSPVFSFSIDEIAAIRVNSRRSSFYMAIKEYVREFHDDLSSKLEDMLNKITCWKKQSRYMPIHDFIWHLVISTGYYNYVSAMPGGKHRQANIRVLADRAKQYSDSSVGGLFNFIQLIEGIKETERDLSSAKVIGPDEEVVRIMSIHKSKGLEFPVVFIGGMGKNINFQDSMDSIIFHKDLGICPDYVDVNKRTYCPTIFKSIAKEKLHIETISEEMRILYVALTRARDMLYLVGTVKDWSKYEGKHKSTSPYDVATASTYLDWVIPSVYRINEKNMPLAEFCQLKSSEIVGEDIKEVDRRGELIEHLNCLDVKGEVDRRVDEVLSWEYKYKELSRRPVKATVTELKQGAPTYIHISESFNVPKFIEDRNISGVMRGNNLHWIMQHIDLEKLKKCADLKEEVKVQVEKLYLNDIKGGEWDPYYYNKVLKFFNSSVGRRMLNSDKVYREKPFNYKMELEGDSKDYILVQGIIDCFFLERDKYVLIDYKSDYYSDEKSKDILVQNYTPQLDLYKKAIESLTKTAVDESYIYFFHGGEIASV